MPLKSLSYPAAVASGILVFSLRSSFTPWKLKINPVFPISDGWDNEEDGSFKYLNLLKFSNSKLPGVKTNVDKTSGFPDPSKGIKTVLGNANPIPKFKVAFILGTNVLFKVSFGVNPSSP